MAKIYIIPFHVKGGNDSILPEGLERAFVSCYVVSENYIDATKLALKKLSDDGLYPEEILQPINEIDISFWPDYLNDVWPDFLDNFPKSFGLDLDTSSNNVIYSPFAAYD